MLKLGVNIDHVATLREARYRGLGHGEPDPVPAAINTLAKSDVEAELLRLKSNVFHSGRARLQTAALMKVLSVMNGGRLN